MITRGLARADYVVGGALVWSAPGYLVGWLAEPAWAYVFFPLLAYGAWRGATVRVAETPEGLHVRNTLRTHHVAWADVTDVSWSEPQDGTWEAPPGFVVPRLRVRGRRRRVAVCALACWLRPARAEFATVRRWSANVAA